MCLNLGSRSVLWKCNLGADLGLTSRPLMLLYLPSDLVCLLCYFVVPRMSQSVKPQHLMNEATLKCCWILKCFEALFFLLLIIQTDKNQLCKFVWHCQINLLRFVPFFVQLPNQPLQSVKSTLLSSSALCGTKCHCVVPKIFSSNFKISSFFVKTSNWNHLSIYDPDQSYVG